MQRTIYVLDDWNRIWRGEEGPSRRWDLWIPEHIGWTWDTQGGCLVRPDNDEVCLNGMVIVHWTYFTRAFAHNQEEAQRQLKQLADSHPGLTWIVISGADLVGPVEPDHRIYYRGIKVKEDGEDAFKHFFSEFLRHAQSGKIDFTLLEPEPRPHALLTVRRYLLKLASKVPSHETWTLAKEQFTRVARRGNGRQPVESEEVAWLNHAQWPEDILATPDHAERCLATFKVVIDALGSRENPRCQ